MLGPDRERKAPRSTDADWRPERVSEHGRLTLSDLEGMGYDIDCRNVGHEVVIDGPDLNGLYGDANGIGCDGWTTGQGPWGRHRP